MMALVRGKYRKESGWAAIVECGGGDSGVVVIRRGRRLTGWVL